MSGALAVKIFLWFAFAIFIIGVTMPFWYKSFLRLIDTNPKWERRVQKTIDYLNELHPNRTQREFIVLAGIIIFFLWILAK